MTPARAADYSGFPTVAEPDKFNADWTSFNLR